MPWGLRIYHSELVVWLVHEMVGVEEDDVPGQYRKEGCTLSGHALGLQKLCCDRSSYMLHTAQETSLFGVLCVQSWTGKRHFK